jgi:hypothetical protein
MFHVSALDKTYMPWIKGDAQTQLCIKGDAQTQLFKVKVKEQ